MQRFLESLSIEPLRIGVPHTVLYLKVASWILSLITYSAIPRVRKITPKITKMIIVEP